MPSLKEYRNRIVSVKSTRKITSAMKMVAAAKLKRAQTQAEASQPYATRMANMLARLAASVDPKAITSPLLVGTGKSEIELFLVVTSDRGLCGGFNSYVVRLARQKIREALAADRKVKIITVGRKGRDQLRRDFSAYMIDHFEGIGKSKLSFSDADQICQMVFDKLDRKEFDICTMIYNRFKSVLTQIPTAQQLIPFALPEVGVNDNLNPSQEASALYTFEPTEQIILESLLPKNLSVQVYGALLDSAAGEQAARMTAMDNATRNAGEMIAKLTLSYNRARQAYITKELIEIISGAEAV